MFAEHLLDRRVRNLGPAESPDAFALMVRLNWYRSLPVSAIEQLALTIDGEQIAPSLMTLRLGQSEYPVGELGERDEDWWFVLDAGELVVRRPGGLAAGEHSAELSMATRIPYFGPGPDGRFSVMTDHARTTVVAA